MSRCRACNVILNEFDLRRIDDEEPEEYCLVCRQASDFPDLLDWKWRQFEDETSAVEFELFDFNIKGKKKLTKD